MDEPSAITIISSMNMVMDYVTALLRRGGLAIKNSTVGELSVFNIRGANRFDGRMEHSFSYLGCVRFHSDSPTLHRPAMAAMDGLGFNGTSSPDAVLDIADPNCHIALLKFFGVDDYMFQIFDDHHVFAGL